jgi:hypothetical protein
MNITTTQTADMINGGNGWTVYTQCGVDIITNPSDNNLANVNFYHVELMALPCRQNTGSSGTTAMIIKVSRGISTIWSTLDI